MNILIITQYFWPENFPINDLVLGLSERGHELTVITGIPNYPEGRFYPGYGLFKNMRQDYHGVKVLRVPLIPRGKGEGFRLALNYLSFALVACILGPIIHRAKCDLIFVYEPSPITVGLPALVFKKMKSAPIFFWIQDLWPESLSATKAVNSETILKIVKLIVQFIYRGCDRLLVQSLAFAPAIRRFGVQPDRIEYFPNSAHELYQPLMLETDEPEYAQMPSGFRVMYGGNIGAAQDFGTILKAAESLKNYPDIHWVIIGDGRMRPWVEKQIQRLNLKDNVHLLGKHPAEAMPRYFSLADVLLVTLKKEPIFALTIPSKVQPYLACGKPIIAALDGEGARIIQEAGAGLTVSAENPHNLAEAVLAMYHMDESDRRAMGDRGRIYFKENFDRSLLLNRLDGWMKEQSVKEI